MDWRERFWKHVDKLSDDECWNWVGHKNEKGYGMISYDGKTSSKAHRVMWEREYGKIPDGLHVLHICDNPSCVNPNHLRLGTHQDNMIDMTVKGRAHRISLGKLPLTGDDIKEIRRRWGDGEIMKTIAFDFDVSESTISNIVHSRSWGWVSDD